MTLEAYYVPVAVRESAKLKALALVRQGYIQSTETIVCSLCPEKYLLLCDHIDSGRHLQRQSRRHDDAVRYFNNRVKECHASGHLEDLLVMPYELHMISSSHEALELPDFPDLKIS